MSLTKLGDRNYTLISMAVKITGNYAEAYYYCEEQLYVDEAEDILNFLNWVQEDIEKRGFGSATYELRFDQWKQFKINEEIKQLQFALSNTSDPINKIHLEGKIKLLTNQKTNK